MYIHYLFIDEYEQSSSKSVDKALLFLPEYSYVDSFFSRAVKASLFYFIYSLKRKYFLTLFSSQRKEMHNKISKMKRKFDQSSVVQMRSVPKKFF